MLQQQPVKMKLVILWETTMLHLNPNVCLSIVMDRSGIVFITNMKHYGNDTRKLRPKVRNKYVSLFISMCITNQRGKYGYGYKMGTGRLKRQRILLPIDDVGQPHWEFMEQYMRNIESQHILHYLQSLRPDLNTNL